MSKFHISPTTGRVNICRATVQACPIGGDHYDSKESAHAAYESKNEALNTTSLKKNQTVSYDEPKAKQLPIGGSALNVDTDWTVIPGEGRFKFITSDEGSEKASIQLRDGFYILGARDANGGFVHFQENSFISEDDALKHLAKNKRLLIL